MGSDRTYEELKPTNSPRREGACVSSDRTYEELKQVWGLAQTFARVQSSDRTYEELKPHHVDETSTSVKKF